MYKKNRHRQYRFSDFNQPTGLKMNPENRWVKKAAAIPWDDIEERYADLFPSTTGNPAKPLRMALGSLLIQKQYDYSDRELVEQIIENPYYQYFIGLPYYQYFIGLPGYQSKPPFVPSLLVEFRKRLSDDILEEINEMIIAYNSSDDPPPGGGTSDDSESPDSSENENNGTLLIDATCAPQNIAFPQDINLLNEARENLEGIIDTICYEYNEYRPRTYRMNARKDYLSLAKSRKRTSKRNRKNLAYCKEHGIRLSGPPFGRPKKTANVDRKITYTDAVDRIEVERSFSLAKRSFGLGLIWTKLETTTRSSIALSIIAMNLDRIAAFFTLFFGIDFQCAVAESYVQFCRKNIVSVPEC